MQDSPQSDRPADNHSRSEPAFTGRNLDLPQLVDRILEINPTAGGTYLSGFGRDALSNYLDHLVATSAPRGRSATWVRRAETPGITARRARDARD
jgi:hypothetical protein